MERADENCRAVAGRPVASIREMGNRRALRDIKNLVGAPPYPCAIAKQPLKNDGDDQRPALASRRPITRKFAASLASKEPSSHQVTGIDVVLGIDLRKKPIAASDIDINVIASKSTDDTDMDDSELTEVEMEDIVEDEPVPDIDSADSNNPLAAVEYVEDIYNFYRETEATACVHPNYMSNQLDINEKMRAILIDWLIEVHYKFELMDETLFLTVNIIDRYLQRQTVPRKKLQLVGVTAMLLACKYEEVSVPVVDDLVIISDRAYAREEVLDMEKSIVNTLQFNMSVPTPYVFMRRFLKAADSDRQLELLSFFILELCLVEYQMLKYQPSLLAAAAVYTSQCCLNRCKHWTRTSELHSRYSAAQLLECSQMMVDFHQNAGTGKLTGVHKKYSTFRFGCAAKVAPALFLLEP